MMKISNRFIPLVVCFVISLQTSLQANAQEPASRNIIEFATKVGYTNFDSERSLENDIHWGFSIGLHMTPSWMFQLDYSRLHTEDANTTENDIWVRYYAVDAIYLFRRANVLRPYVIFGFGQMDVRGQHRDDNGKAKDDDSDNFLRGGLGLQYRLNERWALRGDYRALRSLDLETTSNTVNFSVAYRFSGGGF